MLAGLGAGVGTGFAGMSAAVVISPVLFTFLDIPFYDAVGIALASDVLASAASAITYKKNKNIDMKNAIVMMVTILLFTLVGSYVADIVADLVPNSTMGNLSVIMTLFLGLKFLIKPTMATRESMDAVSPKKRLMQSIVSGIYIGFVCGFIGAGGGMMMLFVLTVILGYELKCAVGTSVFIMAFTALTGAISHFAIGGMPDIAALIMCIIFTLLFATVASQIANKVDNKLLNRLTGGVLVILSIAIIAVNMSKMLA